MATRALVASALIIIFLSDIFQQLYFTTNAALENKSNLEQVDDSLMRELEAGTVNHIRSEEDEDSGGEISYNSNIDEKDVVVLSKGNFSRFLRKNRFRFVMVEFYAPWCGYCQALAPQYAAAATELKGEAILAKLDGTQAYDLMNKYNAEHFPTLLLFINDRIQKPYTGEHTKEDIVRWVRRKSQPAVTNLTTIEDAEALILNANNYTIAVALLDTLEGHESNVIELVAKQEDYVLFYQTTSEDVAALFGINRKAKRPVLVLVKKEPEKITYFEGNFENGTLFDFVIANRLPLVTTYTAENATLIFGGPIQKQLMLFVTAQDYVNIKPEFQEAAKSFKGKIIFLHVDSNDEEDGKPVLEYFGIRGTEARVMAYDDSGDGIKFLFDGEICLDNIKAFAEDFLAGKLKPFYKSDTAPEKNDGNIKIVVGNNFEEIVLDESKDVLLEIYAPWCEHCQQLEPIYNILAEKLRGVESLVIAKMDGSANEHPQLKFKAFPTLLLYPAGNKSSEPIPVDSDRTVKAFYKFLKKHAAIPFKLPKTDNARQDVNAADVKKDEL